MTSSGRFTELLDKVEQLQGIVISHATGALGSHEDYSALRGELLKDPVTKDRIPGFVRNCRDLGQFWQFIKRKFATYAERREFIWAEFKALIEALVSHSEAPSDVTADGAIRRLGSDIVHDSWRRALDRRLDDPEGAITSARTLLESVCKHILENLGDEFDEGADLPHLYRLCSKALNLAPSQHSEQVFKQILGGCTAVVEGLGAVRNRLGDAHGKGRVAAKPAPRHAELAVNLAGSMAAFLVATWEDRS